MPTRRTLLEGIAATSAASTVPTAEEKHAPTSPPGGAAPPISAPEYVIEGEAGTGRKLEYVWVRLNDSAYAMAPEMARALADALQAEADAAGGDA